MPRIQVKLIKGVFTETQKRKMIAKLTEPVVKIQEETMRPGAGVVVEEIQ